MANSKYSVCTVETEVFAGGLNFVDNYFFNETF